MKLSVNIDHIATVREARKGSYPDPLEGALEALRAGAHGITFHLREDRRHIQDADVYRLKKQIQAPLNFEGALYPQIIKIILDTNPAEATFVPERREEVTTEGGLNVLESKAALKKFVPSLKAQNIIVSLFVDPDPVQIEAAADYGADAVELHTGAYAHATGDAKVRELAQLSAMTQLALDQGLIVNAGHGLNYENTPAIIGLSGIKELNIGHSIVGRSLFVGFYEAVREMLKIIEGAKTHG